MANNRPKMAYPGLELSSPSMLGTEKEAFRREGSLLSIPNHSKLEHPIYPVHLIHRHPARNQITLFILFFKDRLHPQKHLVNKLVWDELDSVIISKDKITRIY